MYAARMQAAKQEIQVSGNIQNANFYTASSKLGGLMVAHLNNHSPLMVHLYYALIYFHNGHVSYYNLSNELYG